MQQLLRERIRAAGPKKILTCDGGGIRGLLSVEILAQVEHDLRVLTRQADLVLGDWFDFVCGTSTGAIIATCVACGMSVDQIRRFYLDSGDQMFDRAFVLKRLKYSYNDEPLAKKLQLELNLALEYQPDAGRDFATLGDEGLRSLLMMVMHNHTTDSPWPVSNNPFGKYNQLVRDDGTPRTDCNLGLPLWQLVRASTAAPTFFPPEVVTFAEGTPQEYQFVFVDGGVTTYNNPAFLAFQMATASPYCINWATGTEQLMIVSVGTGRFANARPDLSENDLWLLDHAKNIPSTLLNAAADGWDMACRTVGQCRFGAPIDRDFGAMVMDGTSDERRLFSYVRYNPDMTNEGLDALGLADLDVEPLRRLDGTEHIAEIRRVGVAYAERWVDTARHFTGFIG